MTLSYKEFCRFWGKGFLIAAIIAGCTGLLSGNGEWVMLLYQGAAILLVLALVFLAMGKMIKEQEPEEH